MLDMTGSRQAPQSAMEIKWRQCRLEKARHLSPVRGDRINDLITFDQDTFTARVSPELAGELAR